MSIAKRVRESLEKLDRSDFEGALIPTCIALDATATKFYRRQRHSGKSYKAFVKENVPLITKVAFGVTIGAINLGYKHPDVEIDSNGCCTIESIFYHVVRCGLVHGSGLPDSLTFEPGKRWRCYKDILVLPAELVFGFLMAVVCCPANTLERIPEYCGITVAGATHPINRFWGKPEKLHALYKSTANLPVEGAAKK